MIGKVWTAGLVLAVVAAGSAAAQRPGNARQGGRRAALLEGINQAFLNQVTSEMALTPEQLPKFRRVVTQWAQRRAALEAEESELRQALKRELTPGVAANPDSVSRFVDALNANRVTYSESFRDEMRELAPILTPVQRGQFQLRRDQLLQRVRDLQLQRPGGALRSPANQEP
ncbi:MAG: hypothetical protein ACREK8_03655 [Gemmatimonadales bacterium]